MKEGRHERGFGLFLKELNMDSLNRRLESYCLQTTEALAYWMSLMHLPPTLPSWARSEASIFFPTRNFKIRKGRRSCCEILRYPLGLGAKLLFFYQLKSLRSERDVELLREFPTSNRSKPYPATRCWHSTATATAYREPRWEEKNGAVKSR